jgi:excisionase family DNA binding protein
MDEVIYTIPEVARQLKLSTSKVYYLVQRREIPHVRLGRNVRIRAADLRAWLARSQVSARR